MPQPTRSSAHIDRAITNVVQRYSNPLYIAPMLAPVVPVAKESDKYFIFDKGEWFRDVADDDRQPGTRAPRGGFTLSNATYELKEIAQAMAVPDRIAANADEPVRPYEDAADWVMQMVMLRRERRAAANLFATSIWGTDLTLTGTDQWSDFENSDPASNFATAKDTILANTGLDANVAVMGQEVFSKLKLHPDGLDRFKHTQTGVMTPAMVAEWLEIPRLIIGKATRNTAMEGQTASMSFIWGKSVLIAYVTDAPSISTPSAAYMFQQKDIATKRYREEAEAQEVVEAALLCDPKATGTDLGYFIATAVA